MTNILLGLNLEQLTMLAHNDKICLFFRITSRVKDFSEVRIQGASVPCKIGEPFLEGSCLNQFTIVFMYGLRKYQS